MEQLSNEQHISNLTMSDSMLNVYQVMAKLNIGKTSVYSLVKSGELPKPVKIGGSARWLPDEIATYLENIKAKRDEPHPVSKRGRPRKCSVN